jgi:hypothetical protein
LARSLPVRRETGKVSVVPVHRAEEIENDIDPWPFAGAREDVGEGSVAERIGQATQPGALVRQHAGLVVHRRGHPQSEARCGRHRDCQRSTYSTGSCKTETATTLTRTAAQVGVVDFDAAGKLTSVLTLAHDPHHLVHDQ